MQDSPGLYDGCPVPHSFFTERRKSSSPVSGSALWTYLMMFPFSVEHVVLVDKIFLPVLGDVMHKFPTLQSLYSILISARILHIKVYRECI